MENENSQSIIVSDATFKGSYRLTFLYLILGILYSGGFISCCTLAKLFKQYHFNHANFSTIFSNLLICLAVNNFIQFGRVVAVFIQWIFDFQTDLTVTQPQPCLISLMNNSIMFFILGGCIFCLIERAYATMNYGKYEHEDYSQVLGKAFNFMWFIAGFIIFINTIVTITTMFQNSYYVCVFNDIKAEPVKVHWQVYVSTLCSLAFLLLFGLLLRTNVERRAKSEKPQAQYRLGTAYQLRENCYGIRLMLWFTSSFLLCLGLYIYHIQKLYEGFTAVNFKYDDEYMIFWKELALLYFPIFTIIMPGAIIFSSSAICRRLNNLWLEFCQKWRVAAPYQSIEI